MTHLALFQALTHITEEFDRLRLSVADRLETHEEAAFLGLIFALEEIIERLPTLAHEEDTACP